VSKALPYGAGGDLTSRFDALARGTMPAAPVPLSPGATSALCSTIAASDAFHAWREWNPPPSATAVIRQLAEASGAKSIAMPVMRLYATCEQDKKTCRLDRYKDFGLFLFSADGTILYRATRRAGMGSSEDPEPQMNEVLANIPATFSASAGGGMAAPAGEPRPPAAGRATPAAYSPPAAPQGVGPNDPQIDDALGELDGKAPGDCKKFAKKMCRNASVPDASRLQMCAGYVKTVNQMLAQQGAKAADACKAMVKSAP
jgi:hypothetical protein